MADKVTATIEFSAGSEMQQELFVDILQMATQILATRHKRNSVKVKVVLPIESRNQDNVIVNKGKKTINRIATSKRMDKTESTESTDALSQQHQLI